jgi:hypothetical protein
VCQLLFELVVISVQYSGNSRNFFGEEAQIKFGVALFNHAS